MPKADNKKLPGRTFLPPGIGSRIGE